MKKLFFIAIMALAFGACNQNANTAKTTENKDSLAEKSKTADNSGLLPGDSLYGVAFDYKSAAKLTDLMADPSKMDTTKDIAVSAVVTAVCQEKGCWFRADDGKGGDVFVKILTDEKADKEVGIPMNTAAGRSLVFYGTPKFREVSVKQQRHYLEDAGKSKAEIEAIKTPIKAWRFFATGVVVKGNQ